ncbi:hypothetical protein GCM10020219_088340 [Nonomuraea dietziae]
MERSPEVEKVRPGLWSIPVPIPINPPALRPRLRPRTALTGWRSSTRGGNTDEAYDALVTGLAVAGYSITDVRAVLVTHIHPDHYGLAGRVREVSGAWIALHPADARLLRDRYDDDYVETLVEQEKALLVRSGVPQTVLDTLAGASMMIRHMVTMARPDRLVEDGDRLDLRGWDLRAVVDAGALARAPVLPLGVAQGAVLGRPRARQDHSDGGRAPAVHAQPAGRLSRGAGRGAQVRGGRGAARARVPLQGAGRARRLRDRPPRGQARGDRRSDRRGRRITCWDIATRLTWSRPWESIQPFMRRAANNETLAHLAWLEAKGRVRRTHWRGDLWYSM